MHLLGYHVARSSLALIGLGAIVPATAAFNCPLKLEGNTLTMQCSTACPDPLSPCLYYSNVENCQVDTNSNSVCVKGTNGDCAVECFTPFSGDKNESWNLMITNEEEYGHDVIDAKNTSRTFRIAKKALAKLDTITDLTFPPTAKTISIVGNALPIVDRIVDYPVIFRARVVELNLLEYGFLKNAVDATAIYIENLDLSKLTTFPSLVKLEKLHLANTLLRAVPDGINSKALPALKELDLSLNNLVTIPNKTLPTTLETLFLGDCSLEVVPTDLMSMPNLKALDLSYNPFPLPRAGSLPLQLERLSWWGLNHKGLPEDFPKMTKLRSLELGWNDVSDASRLARLPPSLHELHMLEALLVELPSSLANLTKLTYLEVARNSLKSVPAHVLPPSLTFLNLSVNWIHSIEPVAALPPSLQTLDLAVNVLRNASFPVDFDTQIPNVTHLYLHDNYLEAIPPQLFALHGLQVLTLHKNGNMTRANQPQRRGMTLTTEQIAFLGRLKTFTIDPDVFETNCNEPMAIGQTDWRVCRTGDPTIRIEASPDTPSASTSNKNEGPNDNRTLILGVSVALGGLITILIGVVYWKKRRNAAAAFAAATAAGGHYDDHNKKGSEFFALADDGSVFESSRATDYSDMDSLDLFSQKKSKRRGEKYSIWDDEELLQRRIDFQAIHDVELISCGSYGEVWLAIYMNKHVAVKRMRKNPSGRGGGIALDGGGGGGSSGGLSTRQRSEIQQFVHEIKFHMLFDHPRIVAFIGVAWTMESDLQAVVEYLPNGDLLTYLTSLQPKIQALDDEDERDPNAPHHWDECAVRIALDVAEALVYLHSLDPPVLHRDLKSRNVLLDDQFRAKVSDFGISRHHYDDDTKALMTSGIGTARWTAPEVLTGDDRYTSAVDIYSLGVILSELDTWNLPFAKEGLPESALLSRICVGELQPTFRASSPPEIVTLARQCLSFEPIQRPSAVDVAYLLRQYLAKSQQRMTDSTRVRGFSTQYSGRASSSSNWEMAV